MIQTTIRLAWLGCVVLAGSLNAAPYVAEIFSTDPVAGGRFIQQTSDTESSFTYRPLTEDLLAVLDVDADVAYYLSTPFASVTERDDVSFSINFRVLAIDDTVLPSAFIGFVTTNHVAYGGDGLTMVLSSTNGLPTINAAVDQGPVNSGGPALRLALNTDYLAVGSYIASNRQFAVEIYTGSNFVTWVGRSTAWATNAVGTNTLGFQVDRIGLLNDGARVFDQAKGSVTVAVDNLFVPARPPVFLSVTNTGVVEGNSSTTNAVFTLRLSSSLVQTVTVDYATADLTARAGEDYLSTNGTARFLPGMVSTTVEVQVLGDRIAEPDGTFKLILSNAVNANLIVTQAIAMITNDDLCVITIDDVAVTEPTNGTVDAVFTVSLSLTNNQAVAVRYGTTNGTAVAGGDFAQTNGLLVFDPGITTTNIRVAVNSDSIEETNEIFFVSLGDATNAAIGVFRGQCIITNNSPPPTIFLDGFAFVTEPDSGSTNMTFVVHLSAPSGKTVTATFTTFDSSAQAWCDYLPTNRVIALAPGQTNSNVFIPVFGDTIYEGDEDFYLWMTDVTNAVPGNDLAQGYIANNDPIPRITIEDTGIREGDSGSTNAIFRVLLSNPNSEPVSVSASTQDGTALAGNDYVATNRTLVFTAICTNQPVPSSATNLTFVVPVIGDPTNEADETFSVTLGTPANAVCAKCQALCTVTNDDWVCVSISDNQVVETDGGSTDAVFAVTLSSPSYQQVTMTYLTRDGTARAGSDYLSMSNGFLSFPSDTTTQFINIPVNGDIADEPNEAFSVVLTNLVNATFCKRIGTNVVIDNDPPAISVFGLTVDEPTNGFTNITFTLSLSSVGTNDISVDFATADGSATAGVDFCETNGTLVFPAGTTTLTLPSCVYGDLLYEGDENFFLNLSNAQNATIGNGQAVCTILDYNTPWVDVTNIIIVEGSCTNVEVWLSHPSIRPITVRYCLNGAPTNVVTTCGSNCCTLVIEPGIILTNFQLCAISDGRDTPDGGFRLDLGFGDGGGGRFVRTNVPGLMIDTNPPSVFIADAGVLEGSNGITSLCFPIRLSTPYATNVLVDFVVTDLTARGGDDYLMTNGTHNIPPGTTNSGLCISVLGDLVFESNETLRVCLTNVVNGYISNACATGTITNDDKPPRITIDDVWVVEGDTGTIQAVFTVSVLSPTSFDVVLGYVTVDGTATNGFDYTAAAGTLRIPPDKTNDTVSVSVLGDTYDEPNETFLVRLTLTDTNATLAKTNGVGTIIDDDPPEVRVMDSSVVEGNGGTTNLIFRIILSSTNSVPVFIDYYTADDTAQAGADYVAVTDLLRFDPGQTTQTVAVPVVGETLTELNETFLLCLTNATNATLARSVAQGTIVNDDTPCLSITNVTVIESTSGISNAIFPVWLDFPSALEVSVSYVVSNGTATAGFDFIAQSGTLVFSPGTTNTNITVVVNSDLEVETNETFYVYLFGTNNARLCVDRGVGTIIDGTIPPILSVEGGSVVEGDGGTTNLIFRVSISRASPQLVGFDYVTVDGTASNGVDIVTSSGLLRLLPNHLETNFVVPVRGDCSFEPDEWFGVRLTNVQFAALATNWVLGTILNDDQPPLLCVQNATVTERDDQPTNALFRFFLSCPSAFSANVDFATANGSATAGTDYVSTNGTVLFQPGVTNILLGVPVPPDCNDEPDEEFFLILGNETGAFLCTNVAMGRILNDDDVRIRITDVQIYEPTNGMTNARFALTLSRPKTGAVTVDYYTVDASATAADLDYTPTNGRLSFLANTTNATIIVPILSDTLDESNETFLVYLTNAQCAALETNRSRAVCTILDTNPPCITIDDIFVRDVGSTQLFGIFTVTLSSTSTLPICVSFTTSNGTAIAGQDYVAKSGVLCFSPGASTQYVTIQVMGNTRDETNEYFYVAMSNPTNATFCKPIGVGTIGTRSNEPPVAWMLAPDTNACLNRPTNLLVTAGASDSDGIILRVEFFANGNELGRDDKEPYEFLWRNVPPGDYALTAVAVDNALDRGTSAPVRITVTDPTRVLIDDAEVLEGDTGTRCLDFTLRLSSSNCHPVTLDVSTVNQTAASNDYTAVLTNLVFFPGETQQVVCVPVHGDTEIESNETFLVVLTNVVNASLDRPQVIATIINDDTNLCPVVSLISPLNGAVFYTPGAVPILADARDIDGVIRRVDFYANDVLLGVSPDPSRPQGQFSFTWVNPPAGFYPLTAVATDNSGCSVTSAPVGIVVSNCIGHLTATPLVSQTACACGTVTFSTGVSNSEPVSFVWKHGLRILPGEVSSNLVLQSLKSFQTGQYTVEIRTPCRSLTNSATLTIEGEGIPNPLRLTNTNRIVINAHGRATPFPSGIEVRCLQGVVKKVTASVSGLSHEFPGDIDMLLSSPAGPAVKLMSDVVEDEVSIEGINLGFDDDAPTYLPEYGVILSGTYKPTDYGNYDPFPISPLPLLGTNLAIFTNSSPNGLWGLYVVDDATLQVGGINKGWAMTIDWDPVVPRLSPTLLQTDHQVLLRLESLPGMLHIIECSTNLMDWIPVSTNTLAGRQADIELPRPSGCSHCFYRVLRCPCMSAFPEDCHSTLAMPVLLQDGRFQVTLRARTGQSYVIQESSDLEHWTPVFTGRMSNSQDNVVLPAVQSVGNRFYRAVCAQ